MCHSARSTARWVMTQCGLVCWYSLIAHKVTKIRVTTVKISTVVHVGDHLLRRLRGGSRDDLSMNFHCYGKLRYRR
jgi:hypothetical protein